MVNCMSSPTGNSGADAVRRCALVVLVFVAGLAMVFAQRVAYADSASADWGYGQITQMYWTANCRWWDVQHDYISDWHCYTGVASYTHEYALGYTAKVEENALAQGVVCDQGDDCNVLYQYIPGTPSIVSAVNLAETSEYYCGPNCAWPVNVIGFAYHYGPVPGEFLYTEANWGAQYVS